MKSAIPSVLIGMIQFNRISIHSTIFIVLFSFFSLSNSNNGCPNQRGSFFQEQPTSRRPPGAEHESKQVGISFRTNKPREPGIDCVSGPNLMQHTQDSCPSRVDLTVCIATKPIASHGNGRAVVNSHSGLDIESIGGGRVDGGVLYRPTPTGVTDTLPLSFPIMLSCAINSRLPIRLYWAPSSSFRRSWPFNKKDAGMRRKR